jgi:hypothetical protein
MFINRTTVFAVSLSTLRNRFACSGSVAKANPDRSDGGQVFGGGTVILAQGSISGEGEWLSCLD